MHEADLDTARGLFFDPGFLVLNSDVYIDMTRVFSAVDSFGFVAPPGASGTVFGLAFHAAAAAALKGPQTISFAEQIAPEIKQFGPRTPSIVASILAALTTERRFFVYPEARLLSGKTVDVACGTRPSLTDVFHSVVGVSTSAPIGSASIAFFRGVRVPGSENVVQNSTILPEYKKALRQAGYTLAEVRQILGTPFDKPFYPGPHHFVLNPDQIIEWKFASAGSTGAKLERYVSVKTPRQARELAKEPGTAVAVIYPIGTGITVVSKTPFTFRKTWIDLYFQDGTQRRILARGKGTSPTCRA